jgi:glycosyltransferase involved in cell wall biosynthesis
LTPKHQPLPFAKVVFLGNSLPRQCGIATFTGDLSESIATAAPELSCLTAVMNDIPEGYSYPDRVRFELDQNELADYRRFAEFLNMGQADLLCVQHEFGIYGGVAGGYLLTTLRQLQMPIVTTLHTVLHAPDEDQRRVMNELCRLSDRLVVMSERSIEFLREIYHVPEEKIDLIHHGIPDMPFVDPNFHKDKFQVEGRDLILTFGLLSPNKGIEYMIDALPAGVRRFPNVVNIVLGVTHPAVKRERGEVYRLGLKRHARVRGVEDHVIFHDRFVDLPELCEYLGAADIYVTPYLAEAQIVSGTLAYAFGNGKAVVSTPYWYAEELLADNRGTLVAFRDGRGLAEAIIDLLENPVKRHAMRKNAYAFGRQMVWSEVSQRYLESFTRAYEERRRSGRFNRPRRTEPLVTELPETNFSHLVNLTDETGILQHTRYSVPDRSRGYTTDDNARALIVALHGLEVKPKDIQLLKLAFRYLSFLDHAFDRTRGRFRNFMAYDRRWLEEVGSEDSHGRSLWSLGIAVGVAPDDGQVAVALDLFHAGLPAVETFTSPRAWAFTLIGIHEFLKRVPGDSVARRLREVLSSKLLSLYQATASESWPWFETYMTYDNAVLCQGLLHTGQDIGQPEMKDVSLKTLEWLVRIQTAPEGHFVPVGTSGWQRDGHRSRYDQQPVEAHSMTSACLAAYAVTKDKNWYKEARRAFDWFLGRNDLGMPLYDYTTGGCFDGLSPDGVNLNQGAESTISFLLALLAITSNHAKMK